MLIRVPFSSNKTIVDSDQRQIGRRSLSDRTADDEACKRPLRAPGATASRRRSRALEGPLARVAQDSEHPRRGLYSRLPSGGALGPSWGLLVGVKACLSVSTALGSDGQGPKLEPRAAMRLPFFVSGSSYNDGTTQTARDLPVRAAGSHPYDAIHAGRI
jgi:hypothetical protein